MKFSVFRQCLLLAFALIVSTAHASNFQKIIIPASCHPAIQSAAAIIAQKLSLPASAIQAVQPPGAPAAGEIVLLTAQAASARIQSQIQRDGYVIVFENGGAIIYGARPRSLLYAAGDLPLWQDHPAGAWVRNPDFAIRTAPFYGRQSVADYVATMGVNLIIGSQNSAIVTFKETLPDVYSHLSKEDQDWLDQRSQSAEQRAADFARECHNADVDYYPFLYGNNFQLWSPELYAAVLKTWPSARGASVPNSWELGTLCPSDPMTWKVIDAYVKEFVQKSHGDGLYATFWDHYGLYCHDNRCTNDGLDQFSNELYACVGQYHNALAPLGKKLIVRTWASGVPHWLNDQWVHAPGYGGFSGDGTTIWGRVIHELPSDITLQTKVYNSDCQPDAAFSPLLGNEKPHTEIAEYQITGQTTGRFYFPASTVAHTDWTIRKSLELVGPDGGVSIFPGGTAQSNYSEFDDILNSINLYAWRRLSWNVNDNVDQIWRDWATPIYGPKAAPYVIRALQLSEDAVNHLFSTLGMGSGTESAIPRTIAQREVLLKYTNRYYDYDYAKLLLPTKDNIQRVIDEKNQCISGIDEMFGQLELAKPYLSPAQAAELATRFDWLKQFAVVNSNLEESLWRYRYLRYLASMLTTDPEQMKYLAASYDAVQEHRKLMFRFDPAQKFSCYDVSMRDLDRVPSLGNPMPLMDELYHDSLTLVESEVGPDYLPKGWLR